MSARYKFEISTRDFQSYDVASIIKICGEDETWIVNEEDGWYEIFAPTRTQAAWLAEALVIEEVRFEFKADY